MNFEDPEMMNAWAFSWPKIVQWYEISSIEHDVLFLCSFIGVGCFPWLTQTGSS